MTTPRFAVLVLLRSGAMTTVGVHDSREAAISARDALLRSGQHAEIRLAFDSRPRRQRMEDAA
jgi:hypothetical protein